MGSQSEHIIMPPRGRYAGHDKHLRPEADPTFMQVGPGKPCGEYLRRFWQPVCMTEELGKGVPVRLRILGEDLVAFRDLSGDYGLLHLHCSHRNTSLEFGFIAEHGIRCCYHGWHYAVDGTILETPGEPAGSKIKERTCHGAYPVIEWHGLLFAYMPTMCRRSRCMTRSTARLAPNWCPTKSSTRAIGCRSLKTPWIRCIPCSCTPG